MDDEVDLQVMFTQSSCFSDLLTVFQNINIDTVKNTVVCPRCGTTIRLGTAGIQNMIKTHWKTATCDAALIKNSARNKVEASNKKSRNVMNSWLVPKRPPKVSAAAGPKLLHGQGLKGFLGTPSLAPFIPVQSQTVVSTPQAIVSSTTLPRLAQFAALTDRLSEASTDVHDNALSIFMPHPSTFLPHTSMNADDLWEDVINPMLHAVFWDKSASQIEGYVGNGGKRYLQAFQRFVVYFSQVHKVPLALFEPQLEKLERAIGNM